MTRRTHTQMFNTRILAKGLVKPKINLRPTDLIGFQAFLGKARLQNRLDVLSTKYTG